MKKSSFVVLALLLIVIIWCDFRSLRYYCTATLVNLTGKDFSRHGNCAPKVDKDDKAFFYIHIPKTGGTTSYNMIGSVLEKKNASNVAVLCPYRKQRFLNCNFIHTHSSLGLHKFLQDSYNTPVKLLTSVRNPISVWMSALAHEVRIGTTNYSQFEQLLDGYSEYRSCVEKQIDPLNCSSLFDFEKASRYNYYDRQVNYLYAPDASTKTFSSYLEEFFHVGITEFFFASKCLLMYQFGVFDAKYCQNACQSQARIPHKNTNPEASKIFFQFSMMGKIEFVAKNDNLLYARALSRFMDQIECIENEFEVQLICRTELPARSPGIYPNPNMSTEAMTKLRLQFEH